MKMMKDAHETWNKMVSNIGHKMIEGIGKKMLSKSMRINTKVAKYA